MQVKVKGFKKVQDVNNNVKLYSNGILGHIQLTGSVNQTTTEHVLGTLNTSYAPLIDTSANFHTSTDRTKWVSIRTNRNVVLYGATGSTNLNNSITYVLATPLY